MAAWTPKLTRGLWGLSLGEAGRGARIQDLRDAARAAGEAPDAATLSHLYSRAVGGVAARGREHDYATRVARDVYLARRPGSENIGTMPRGFSMAGRYRQVVQVTGQDPITSQPRSVYVNVQFDRLLSRGEAIDLAIGAVRQGSPTALLGALEGEYEATWRADV